MRVFVFLGILSFAYAGEVSLFKSNEMQENSLLLFAHKRYSQYGEEGVLDAMLQRMGISKGFFVEFGASDGISLCNTRFLAERGWRGVYLEMDPLLFEKLKKAYEGLEGISCLHEFVAEGEGDERGKTFDQLRYEYFPDEEIDFLSIDTNGSEYLIFEGLQCRPKIICIEGSLLWHPLALRRVPKEIALKNFQQPQLVMIDIGKKKGYELVCRIGCNYFFVREEFAELFSEIKRDSLTLWKDMWAHLQRLKEEKWILWERRAQKDFFLRYEFLTLDIFRN